MERDTKEKLYRKNNNRQHWDERNYHPKYKWQRHTKQSVLEEKSEVTHKSMRPKTARCRGTEGYEYDYTPLLKFALSKIGCDVDEVFSEVSRRTNQFGKQLFNDFVSREPKPQLNPVFCYGEGAYFSQLYVDENNKIQKVEPNIQGHWIVYGGQFGQSFNGKHIPFKKGNSLLGRAGAMYEKTGKWWY